MFLQLFFLYCGESTEALMTPVEVSHYIGMMQQFFDFSFKKNMSRCPLEVWRRFYIHCVTIIHMVKYLLCCLLCQYTLYLCVLNTSRHKPTLSVS